MFVSLARAQLAGAQIVIPGVVHEIDAPVDGGVDQLDGIVVRGGLAQVEAAHADQADHLARAAERTIDHVALADLTVHRTIEQRQVAGSGDLRVHGFDFFGGVRVAACGPEHGGGGGESSGNGTGRFEERAAGVVHVKERMKDEG